MIWINKEARSLRPGQRVKLRHMKQLWVCEEVACEANGSFAKITRGKRSQWLSRGWRVQIPIEDDAILGKGVGA